MTGFGAVGQNDFAALQWSASSPFQTLDLGAASDAKGRLRSFAASAKTLGQFPQTGHSPKNGENQATNDWIADKVNFRRNCTNVGFGGAVQQTVVFGVILPANE